MSRANREGAQELIRTDRNLKPGPKLLLLTIGDLVDDGRLLEAGCDYLAYTLGVGKTSVQRWREELVNRGYLIPVDVVAAGQVASTYRLAWATTHERPTKDPPLGHSTTHERPNGGSKQKQKENNNHGDTSPLDPETCHHLIDDEGYCTRCKTWTREPASA